MERRLLHRWYGNVPGDDWPTGVRHSSLLSLRGQGTAPQSAGDSEAIAACRKKLADLSAEEKKLMRKIDIFDWQLDQIPPRERDRSSAEQEDHGDILADRSIAQEEIAFNRQLQKLYYMQLKVFGG